jgi:hypothetical protein
LSYIGKTPVIGNFVKLDAISVVNGQAAYTMQNGGANFTEYNNVNQFLVSLNGILQSPTTSFTVSGSTITFASNLATGDVIDHIIVLGNTLDVGVPSDNTVTAAKLNNDIISGSTELATEPADTDEFLVSDAGTIKRIDYSLIKGGGITELDMFRLTTDTNDGTDADVASNWERVDDASFSKIGTGLTESSGVFSFPSTGIYLISFNANLAVSTSDSFVNVKAKVTQNNSSYDTVATLSGNSDGARDFHGSPSIEFIVDVTDTSNVKFKFSTLGFNTTGTRLRGDTTESETAFTCTRIGDT